jgi:6-phosphogluconolactonase (cycloisomerase 2 family)
MNGKGTTPSRQDAAHPHEVIVDPTRNFILTLDLGVDLIRIYSINNSTGALTSCGNYVETEELVLATARSGESPLLTS